MASVTEKDPSLLTPKQAKQLEQANEMAMEIAKRISAQYDFSGNTKMFSTLETLPMARIAQDAQRFALATQNCKPALSYLLNSSYQYSKKSWLLQLA